MNKKVASRLLLLLFTAISGCQTATPTHTQIMNANYGPTVSPETMLGSVKRYMSKHLFDPLSAIYQCDIPEKAWLIGGSGSEGNVEFGRTYYGYYSVCNINAKNRFGGYVGPKDYYFMIYQLDGTPALAHFDGFQNGGPVKE